MSRSDFFIVIFSMVAGCHVGLGHDSDVKANTKHAPMPHFHASELPVHYLNKEYGFCFALPKTWKGFSIVEGEWSGYDDSDSSVKPAQRTGPMISIRNPKWTKEDPWQDIPIMIFTQKLWPDVASDRLIVSAAPYGPGELGRNSRFVFALPPRYEYAFPNGWEEVTKIAWSHPLKACESK